MFRLYFASGLASVLTNTYVLFGLRNQNDIVNLLILSGCLGKEDHNRCLCRALN